MMFISAILAQNSLPGIGLVGLINGVNIKNNILLVSSDFLFIALVIFNLFGKCEKYLYGYGKYQLLRYKKRGAILQKILVKAYLEVCGFCLSRIIIYEFLLLIRKEKTVDFTLINLINYLTLSILTLFFISVIQIFIELKFSSFAGLITVFSYYVISTMLGGFFLEKEKYFPIIFLTTNFTMKLRTDLLSENFAEVYILYLILTLYIVTVTFACKKTMNHKDIF